MLPLDVMRARGTRPCWSFRWQTPRWERSLAWPGPAILRLARVPPPVRGTRWNRPRPCRECACSCGLRSSWAPGAVPPVRRRPTRLATGRRASLLPGAGCLRQRGDEQAVEAQGRHRSSLSRTNSLVLPAISDAWPARERGGRRPDTRVEHESAGKPLGVTSAPGWAHFGARQADRSCTGGVSLRATWEDEPGDIPPDAGTREGRRSTDAFRGGQPVAVGSTEGSRHACPR